MTNNELEAAKAFINDILVASGHTTKDRRQNPEVLNHEYYFTTYKYSKAKEYASVIADILLLWLDVAKNNPEMLISVMLGQDDTRTPEGVSVDLHNDALSLATSFVPRGNDHRYSLFQLYRTVSNLVSSDAIFYTGLSNNTGSYKKLDSADIAEYVCLFLKLNGVSIDNGKLYNAWAVQALLVDDSWYSFYAQFTRCVGKYGLLTSGLTIDTSGRVMTSVEKVGGPNYMKSDPAFKLDRIITDDSLIQSLWGPFTAPEYNDEFFNILYYCMALEDAADLPEEAVKFDLPKELSEAIINNKNAKVLRLDISTSLNVANGQKMAVASVINFINTNLPRYHIYDNRSYFMRFGEGCAYMFISE